MPETSLTTELLPPAGQACGAPSRIRTAPIRVPERSPMMRLDLLESHAADQYRIVRTRLLQHPAKPQIIVVSSAGPGDGKSVTAANLAAVLAIKGDADVLLADADLRRSSMSAALGLPGGPGLTEVLNGAAGLDEALLRVEQLPSLYVLRAGAPSSNPTEMLDSERWRNIAAELKKRFQFILFDSTPVGLVADYDLIQAIADGVLMVMRPGHTNRKLLTQAMRAVSREKLLGVLLNCVDHWFLWKTNSYGYYGEANRSRMAGRQ